MKQKHHKLELEGIFFCVLFFSGNSFLSDEVAFLQASGLCASMMWDDLMVLVLFF